MLSVEGVTKRYGDVLALDEVSLEIAPGEVAAVVGLNGAGKTTLLSIVAGLRRPDAGIASVGGIDVTARPAEAQRLIGLAPQELGVYPSLSVRDNLKYFGLLSGLSGRALPRRIDQVAEALGIVEVMERKPLELSGGQNRRLHTAMALVSAPPLLLLDEPTAGVDIETRDAFIALVREMARDGAAVFYSTHYLVEVEQLSAVVTILHKGRVVARGSVLDLVKTNGEPMVAFTFRSAAPRVSCGLRAVSAGNVLQVFGDNPGAATARTLEALEPNHVEQVERIDTVIPTFESAFRSIVAAADAAVGPRGE